MKYKFIEHTADVQFIAYGQTLEEAFNNSVLAMTKSICDDEIQKKKKIKIKITGENLESLLYNFLEELIVLFDSEGFLVSMIEVMKIDEKKKTLNCVLVGDSEGKYEIFSHVKAITYSEMFIRKEKNKYVVQVTLDV